MKIQSLAEIVPQHAAQMAGSFLWSIPWFHHIMLRWESSFQ
jgi:hypothetical protein